MITDSQRTAYEKQLRQLGMTNPTDNAAVLDFLYTIATCAVEYQDYKEHEENKRNIR